MAPNYWDYLKLDQLLTLQNGVDADEADLLPDELHFIIVHQAYELWFKLILRSLRLARNQMQPDRVDEDVIPHVVHHLRRVNSILELCVKQFEVMETLTPQDFLDFRDKLIPASGFQSFQMREVEILMGLEEAQRVHYGDVDPIRHIAEVAVDSPAGKFAWARIEQVRTEPTVLHVVNDWLYRTPVQGSSPGDPGDDETITAFIEEYLSRHDENLDANLDRLAAALKLHDKDKMGQKFDTIRAAARSFLNAEGDHLADAERPRIRRIRAAVLFIESYRRLPLLAWPRLLIDMVVGMEEQLVLFRHRHTRMVERLIGRRVGTGGSDGVDYLDKTAKYRVFKDLWAIRTLLLPTNRLPPLRHPERYGFSAE